MKYKLRDDFIGVFENALPEELVDSYLKYYTRSEKEGVVFPRGLEFQDVSDRSLSTISQGIYNLELPYVNKDFINIFFKDIYPIYAQKYSTLNNFQKHSIFDVKIQRTLPGEGYHSWHTENSNMQSRNRVMVFMLYLNDVKDGGETEFLYQKMRVKPKKGRITVFPADFPYVHRGNPPLKKDKYILTSWFNF